MTQLKGHCFTVEGSSDKVSFYTLYVYRTYNVHVVIYCTVYRMHCEDFNITFIKKGNYFAIHIMVGGFGSINKLNTFV
jgi:hypothetical protein